MLRYSFLAYAGYLLSLLKVPFFWGFKRDSVVIWSFSVLCGVVRLNFLLFLPHSFWLYLFSKKVGY